MLRECNNAAELFNAWESISFRKNIRELKDKEG
jgi:hypothetical protein